MTASTRAPAPPDSGSEGREGTDRRESSLSPWRIGAFVALVVVCVVGVMVIAGSLTDPRDGPTTEAGADLAAATPDELAAIAADRHVTLRSTALGPSFGAVAVAPLTGDGSQPGPARPTDLRCDRVAQAADRGLCLVADRGALTTYRAIVFDERFQPVFTIDLAGEPSRARVSPDGDLGSTTVFVSGHSYAQAGFSTATTIIDLRTGTSLGDLEQFTTWRDGAVVDAVDRNFWGVTFATDDATFYATMATGGETFLVRGDLPSRTMTVVQPGVECPSLSPDGSRVAFKQRHTGALGQTEWRLAVLDLATGSVTSTAETRSVDDQPTWLDDGTLLYGLDRDDGASPTTDVWAVAADGSGEPSRFVDAAWSPTVSGS